MSQKSFLAGTPQDLQRNLNDINRSMQEKEAQAQALNLHLPYIDLHNFPVDLNVLGIFTEDEAKQAGAVPFYREGQDMRIGVTDPHNPLLLQKLEELSQNSKISMYLISQASFVQTLIFYNKILRPKTAHDDTVRIEEGQDFISVLKDITDEAKQHALSGSELVEIIFGAAASFKASDIHIEPEAHFVKIRFRIDGVLQDMLHVAKDLQKPLVTRLKILSKLKLNVENVPQDGRLTFYVSKTAIDVRISTLPSAAGEEVVMRLLGMGAVSLRVKDLGLRTEQLEIVERTLAKPNGMTLTTGPTGSGKTTTLYAFLNELNEPGVKIITLEDPVEYKLEGIVQTPIDHTVDFNFAKGLRAVLRQDPDIIMVGEIRDQETAETALQSALTGHLVFSTLHTNDAAGAIPRLLNMGAKPFVVGPALSCVIAQRLVRRVCQACKQPAILAPGVMQKIKLQLEDLPQGITAPEHIQFFHGVGCTECGGLGYKGRTGVYEVLEVTEAIQDLINKQESMSAFKKAGKAQGMVTMTQDGLLKALEGITDVEEVFRVAGE